MLLPNELYFSLFQDLLHFERITKTSEQLLMLAFLDLLAFLLLGQYFLDPLLLLRRVLGPLQWPGLDPGERCKHSTKFLLLAREYFEISHGLRTLAPELRNYLQLGLPEFPGMSGQDERFLFMSNFQHALLKLTQNLMGYMVMRATMNVLQGGHWFGEAMSFLLFIIIAPLKSNSRCNWPFLYSFGLKPSSSTTVLLKKSILSRLEQKFFAQLTPVPSA